jgi:hypothetical protein
MDMLGSDAVVILLVGILVWCVLMLAVEMGNAASDAVARRKR